MLEEHCSILTEPTFEKIAAERYSRPTESAPLKSKRKEWNSQDAFQQFKCRNLELAASRSSMRAGTETSLYPTLLIASNRQVQVYSALRAEPS